MLPSMARLKLYPRHCTDRSGPAYERANGQTQMDRLLDDEEFAKRTRVSDICRWLRSTGDM